MRHAGRDNWKKHTSGIFNFNIFVEKYMSIESATHNIGILIQWKRLTKQYVTALRFNFYSSSYPYACISSTAKSFSSKFSLEDKFYRIEVCLLSCYILMIRDSVPHQFNASGH